MPDVRDLSIPDERPKTETALPKLRSSGSILLSIMEGVKKQDISDDAPNSDVAKYFGNQFGYLQFLYSKMGCCCFFVLTFCDFFPIKTVILI